MVCEGQHEIPVKMDDPQITAKTILLNPKLHLGTKAMLETVHYGILLLSLNLVCFVLLTFLAATW